MNLPILTSLVALPFIGGVAVLLTGRNRPALARCFRNDATFARFSGLEDAKGSHELRAQRLAHLAERCGNDGFRAVDVRLEVAAPG